VRDHNLKTYFPQREISGICIMQDIKLMLINMGTTYFLVDKVSILFLNLTLSHIKVTSGGNRYMSSLVRSHPQTKSVFIVSFYFHNLPWQKKIFERVNLNKMQARWMLV